MFSLNNTAPLARQVDIYGKRSDKLNFPSTRSVLWDPNPRGKTIAVHPTQFRNCSVTFEEQTLRLVQRLSQDCTDDSYRCALQGSIYRQPDGEGMCVCIERMDFNQQFDGSNLTGDVTLPFVLKRNGTQVDMVTADDYESCIKTVHQHCSLKDKIELSRLVSLRSSGSMHMNQDSMSCNLDVDLVMAATTFQATPINSVPIVPSALSKNLSGPVSLSEVQGEPKTGYLTMDQTRKLLLVLESDPKASSLPLVGIWVSGVTAVYDSYVWAACLRYLHSMHLQDRVCVPPENFLVVVYSPLHSRPEFYQITTDDGKPDLKMALYTSHTVVTLPNGRNERLSSPIEVELEQVTNGDKANLFHAALHSTKEMLQYKRQHSVTPKRQDKVASHDDITPRNIPAPHFSKAQIAKPLVPEVSLLYDDNEPITKVPVPTAKQIHNTEKPVTPKNMSQHSPQVRCPSRGPLKPVNRTTAVTANPFIKGGLNTQAQQHRNFGYQHQRQFVHGYDAAVQRTGLPQGSPDTGLPTSPSSAPGPQVQQIMSVPHQHQQQSVSNVVFFPHPSYQMYPGPVNQAPLMSNGAGPSPQNSYPMQQVQNPHIYSQGQFPLHQQAFPAQRVQNQLGTINYHTAVNHQSTLRQGPLLPTNYPNQFVPSVPLQPNSELYKTNGLAPMHQGNTAGNMNLQSPGAQPITSTQSQSPTRHPVQNMQLVSAESSPIHHPESQPSSATASPGSVSTAGSSGSQVPPEVLQLLQHQDQQLKELKEQLASLLAKQNTPEHSQNTPPCEPKDLRTTATQMSAVQTPVKVKPAQRDTCTIATNTSLFDRKNDSHNQTSNTHNGTADTHDSGRGSHRHDTHDSWQTLNDSPNAHYFEPTDQSGTIGHEQYINHRTSNKLGAHSPLREHFANKVHGNNVSPGRTINDNISLNDLHPAQIPNQCQEESMMSQMMVDMPAYYSMSPDKLAKYSNSGLNDTDDSTRSPQIGESVSMYDEQYQAFEPNEGTDAGLGESDPDASLLLKNQKAFYENLRGNIQNFLLKQSSSHQDESVLQTSRNESDEKSGGKKNSTLGSSVKYSGDKGETKSSFNSTKSEADRSVDIAEVTRQQLQKLGVDLDGLSSNDTTLRGEKSLFLFDHSMMMLPRINYTSLMLDNDSDVSADADALAMKYLSDEQLAELAKLRIHSPKTSSGRIRDTGLERLLNNTTLGPSPGISMYGMSANNVSFATKKFLEKYGLATGVKPDVTKSEDDVNESFVDTISSGENEASNNSLHDAKNVKDVLHRLVHQKFLSNGSFCEIQNDSSEIKSEARADQSCFSNCSSNSSQQGESRMHHFSTVDVQRGHGGYRLHSTSSDTTQYRTPERTRVGHNSEERYEKASSDHTPVRVFDDSFRMRQQVRPHAPRDILKHSDSTSQANRSGRQILDIERLKGLPKLL